MILVASVPCPHSTSQAVCQSIENLALLFFLDYRVSAGTWSPGISELRWKNSTVPLAVSGEGYEHSQGSSQRRLPWLAASLAHRVYSEKHSPETIPPCQPYVTTPCYTLSHLSIFAISYHTLPTLLPRLTTPYPPSASSHIVPYLAVLSHTFPHFPTPSTVFHILPYFVFHFGFSD